MEIIRQSTVQIQVGIEDMELAGVCAGAIDPHADLSSLPQVWI
jgi:hypothetical protein